MKEILNELALFAGAGGGLLASKLLGWRTVCYVEWDPYPVEIIKARIRDGYLDDAPIWDDCFSFDGKPWAGLVDVISAGFPCQPFSCSGNGLAEQDPRNGWPAVKRIIGEIRPRFAFLENVPGLISKPYIRRIFGDLAEIGYDAEWGTLSAAAVGANHKRDRLWIVAYSSSVEKQLQLLAWQNCLQPAGNGTLQSVADTDGKRCAKFKSGAVATEAEVIDWGNNAIISNTISQRVWQRGEPEDIERQSRRRNNLSGRETQNGGGAWWATEPELGRVADGVAHRVDRLATIGNGQVPDVARTAWKLLTARITQAPK